MAAALALAAAGGMALALDPKAIGEPPAKAAVMPLAGAGTVPEPPQPGSLEAAIHALESAAENGEEVAIWRLGDIYDNARGVDENDRKAFYLFQRLANDHAEDNPAGPYSRLVSNAFVRLGGYYMAGIPDTVQPNRGHAIRLYRHAAMYFGDPEAQYRLARIHLDEEGGDPDPRMATRWLTLASDKGHIEAQAVLGQLLWLGDRVPRRPVEGLSWLLIAEDGATPAQREWVSELANAAIERADERTAARARARLDAWRARHGKEIRSQPAS